MFGMFNISPEWYDEFEDEPKTEMKILTESVCVDDIVELKIKDMQPVFRGDTKYDALVSLRIVGELWQSSKAHYLVIVTDCDSHVVRSSLKIDKHLAKNYEIDSRFLGCDAIEIARDNIVRVTLAQRGRSCSVCNEYNKDVRVPKSEEYRCQTCKFNPYR